MMRQAQIAEGMISKLRHSLAKLKDACPEYSMTVGELLLVDVADAMRELHRYVVLVERKCEEVEVQANRRRFHPF